MYRLAIQTTISAAHHLKDYQGNCSMMHGHNWKIQVEVTSTRVDNVGMVIDFKDLKDLTWQVVGKFDHQVFNNIPPFDKLNPTAEHLSEYFYNEIKKLLPENVEMDRIKIWETDKSSIEYFK